MQSYIFGVYAGTVVLFSIVTICLARPRSETAIEKSQNSPNESELKQLGEGDVSALNLQSLSDQMTKVNATLLKYLRTPELVKDRGYPFEIHNVITKSGYIIQLHRIPGGKFSNVSKTEENDTMSSTPMSAEMNKTGRPVILHHGLWQSSFHYVATSPENSLAFILADEGYDVWLTNSRGNCYSNQHTTRRNTDKKYWDFNLDALGGEDLFETIDFILKATEYESLYYIGFSFGSQVFFAGASLHPEYNNKVKLMIAMSPMAYMSNTKSAVMSLSHLPTTTLFYEMVQATFGYTPVPNPKLLEYISNYAQVFCNKNSGAEGSSCLSGLFGNKNSGVHGSNNIPSSTRAAACPTSSKVIIQLSQIINSNQFGQYDYRFKNLETYGQLTPPLYKLWKVSVPVAMMWTKSDTFNDPADVEKLVRHLPNVVENYRVPSDTFSHTDFLFGPEVKNLVYTKILEYLRKYT